MEKDRALKTGLYDIEYLEKVTLMNWVQKYKKLSFEFLEIKTGSILLDAGCGTGDDVLVLSKLVGDKGKVIGIDIAEEMIKEAKEKTKDIPNIELYQANIYELDFDDNTFDGVRADRVFQHLEHPTKALKELVRVTKSGGNIIVMDPDWTTLVLDHPNKDFTDRYLSYQTTIITNPSSGTKLANMFLDQGLQDVTVVPDVLYLRNYNEANIVWMIETYIDKAINEGVFQKEEAIAWIKEFKTLNEKNRFFGALTGFGVGGTKP
ncbi:MAG: methyltransferase domain-containing protein [Asgard group archaeon]|nr:methyltransferase domain-containing protein [Asgard group archaeon]